MFVLRVVSSLLFATSLVASLPLGDDPITELIKEVIYEADQYMAREHEDQLNLPDFSFHPLLGKIELTNGHLGNFSTTQLRGTPNFTFQNNPDGSTTYHIDLPLGLDHFGILYDFRIAISDIVSEVGNCSIWTKTNLADVNVTLSIGGAQKCSVRLNSFLLEEFEDLQISIYPDDLPGIEAIGEILFDFITPRLIPTTNTVVEKIIATDFFRQMFSKMVCSKVPFYIKN